MNIDFKFADGALFSFDCKPEETILSAAARAGVPILSQCQSGSCGTCIAKLVDGGANFVTQQSSSLLASEREQGYRLTCQTLPTSDCQFDVDYDSALGEILPEQYEGNIEEISWLSNDVVYLKIALPDDDWFQFEPGQFVQLRVPGTDAWRSYSIASGARDMPNIAFYVRILPEGVMSDYLKAEAEVGDLVELEAPFGSFCLRKSKSQHIFIAGGTGLAPFFSMFESIRQYSGSKPKILLSFGCANDAGLFAVNEIEDAAFMLPTLQHRISVEEKLDGDSAALVGNPVAAISAADIQSEEAVAYLCGPPGMIDAARSHLINLGLFPENIFSEQFVSSG
ncbi:MAG: 2Fe-2S iron-sulfur cluster binding domain-containing protein [Pseudomonadota bacterium]